MTESVVIAFLILAGSVFAPALRRYDGDLLPLPSDGCTIAGKLYAWIAEKRPPYDNICRLYHDPAWLRGGAWWWRIVSDWRLCFGGVDQRHFLTHSHFRLNSIWDHGGWHRLEAVVAFALLLWLGGYPWPWRHYRWGGGRA